MPTDSVSRRPGYQTYPNGRYARTDYRQPCDPPLEGEEAAAWAEQLLTRQGRR